MNQDDFTAGIEAECFAHFGPPETRKKKTQRYLRKMVRQHTELLVRQVLEALGRLPHFIPAQHLREVDVFTAPLDSLLAPFEYPQFKVSFVQVDQDGVTVEVSEGTPLAGCGTRFWFQRTPQGLTFVSEEHLWIS
jgi:hypothetical protein